MSVTSQYSFFQGFFNGTFVGLNTVSNADQPFSQSPPNSPVLIVHRPNADNVLDLGPLINTDANVGLVAKQLIAAKASLTSGLRVQGVPWIAVPYFIQSPLAHKPFDMLVKVNFDFHVETPWFCSDIDGTISLFLFVFLDTKGHLQAVVDGTWFSFDGGAPLCAGPASDGLKAALPGVKKQVQAMLPPLLAGAAGIKFAKLHFMPGNGTKAAGGFVQNASNDLALGLILA